MKNKIKTRTHALGKSRKRTLSPSVQATPAFLQLLQAGSWPSHYLQSVSISRLTCHAPLTRIFRLWQREQANRSRAVLRDGRTCWRGLVASGIFRFCKALHVFQFRFRRGRDLAAMLSERIRGMSDVEQRIKVENGGERKRLRGNPAAKECWAGVCPHSRRNFGRLYPSTITTIKSTAYLSTRAFAYPN